MMETLAEVFLKEEVLQKLGLPNIPFPVRQKDLEASISAGGELPLEILLSGLQQRAADGRAVLQDLEPAMAKLASLLSSDDDREVVSAASELWWIEVGPIDVDAAIIAIQRRGQLIAAVSCRSDGRLRVAAFRPLDAKSLASLMNLARTPHQNHGVCMRENNWECALDCSAGMGNHYADDRGEAYLVYWEYGLGATEDGSHVAEWRAQSDSKARPAIQVVTELGVAYEYSDHDVD